MTSYQTGVWITNILAGVLAVSVGLFTVGFGYIMIEALLGTSFSLSLNAGPNSIGLSFDVYGFIAIEACFVGVVVYLGYTTVRNAFLRRIIEVELEKS